MSKFSSKESVSNLIGEVVQLERSYGSDVEFFVLQATDVIVGFVNGFVKETSYINYDLHFDVYGRSNMDAVTYRYQDSSIGVYRPNLVHLYKQLSTRRDSAKAFVLHVLSLFIFELGKSERYNSVVQNAYLVEVNVERAESVMNVLTDWNFQRGDKPSFEEFLQSDKFISAFEESMNKIHSSKISTYLSGSIFLQDLSHSDLKETYSQVFKFDTENTKAHIYSVLDFFFQKNDHCFYFDNNEKATIEVVKPIIEKATAHLVYEFEEGFQHLK